MSFEDLESVFTRAEALKAGLTERQVERRVASGEFLRLRRAIYCQGSAWRAANARDRHAFKAVALGVSLSPTAAVSHASSAVLLGLPMPWLPTPVWATSPTGSTTRYRGGFRVVAAALPPGDVTACGRYSVTTAARTVADCLRHLDAIDAVTIGDAALGRWPELSSSVPALLCRYETWPHAVRALRRWRLLDWRRESPAESWSAVAFVRQRIPPPEPQVTICTPDGALVGRVDFWWDDAGVAGEVDGLVKYGVGSELTREEATRALVAEKQREDRLRRLGVHIVRWGTKDLRHERRWAAELRAELASGDRSRFQGTLRRLSVTPPTYPQTRFGGR